MKSGLEDRNNAGVVAAIVNQRREQQEDPQ